MSYQSIWEKHAIIREGKKLIVYKDSLEKPTVGIGHLVLDCDNLNVGDKITEKRCSEFFEADSSKATAKALSQAREIGIETDWFIAVLISVNFQLGDFKKVFYGTYPKIVAHEFDSAIKSLRRSSWYKQTPVRVEDLINALEKAKTFKQRPVHKTRTVAGGTIAGVSAVASEAVTEVVDKIEPLIDYSDYLQFLFVALTLIGIGVTIHARLDDRKRGHR